MVGKDHGIYDDMFLFNSWKPGYKGSRCKMTQILGNLVICRQVAGEQDPGTSSDSLQPLVVLSYDLNL